MLKRELSNIIKRENDVLVDFKQANGYFAAIEENANSMIKVIKS